MKRASFQRQPSSRQRSRARHVSFPDRSHSSDVQIQIASNETSESAPPSSQPMENVASPPCVNWSSFLSSPPSISHSNADVEQGSTDASSISR